VETFVCGFEAFFFASVEFLKASAFLSESRLLSATLMGFGDTSSFLLTCVAEGFGLSALSCGSVLEGCLGTGSVSLLCCTAFFASTMKLSLEA
jgi:hypothetical protein